MGMMVLGHLGMPSLMALISTSRIYLKLGRTLRRCIEDTPPWSPPCAASTNSKRERKNTIFRVRRSALYLMRISPTPLHIPGSTSSSYNSIIRPNARPEPILTRLMAPMVDRLQIYPSMLGLLSLCRLPLIPTQNFFLDCQLRQPRPTTHTCICSQLKQAKLLPTFNVNTLNFLGVLCCTRPQLPRPTLWRGYRMPMPSKDI